MRRKNNLKKEGVLYLSGKERTMLNMLLHNGRTFNTNIARKLKISSQVTGRIRKKLEKEGVIKDYSLRLDHYFLDINVFVLTSFNMKGFHEDKLMSENLICLYKVLADSVTHIGLYAFKSLEESNDYFNSFIEHSDHIKIINLHISPIEGLIKYCPRNLFYNAIKKFEGEHAFHIALRYQDIEKKKIKLGDLSLSEKNVLISLVKNSIISCKKISSNFNNIKITRTGVNRIKNRLENRNIIREYNVNLDYERLGINVLAFIFISQKPDSLQHKEDLIKRVYNSPCIVGCFKSNNGIALFCGFKNLNKLEDWCDVLRSKCKDLIEVKHVHIISPRGVIKESFVDLYLSLLEN